MFDTAVGLISLYRIKNVASFFVAARYFRNPIVGRVLHLIGAIPVDTDGGALRAIGRGVDCLKAGRSLVIMAEGRLIPPEERTDGIGPLEPGVAVLARRAAVRVVPVALIGADEVLPLGRRLPRIRIGSRATVIVRFGQPVETSGTSRTAIDEVRRELSTLVLSTEAEHDRRSLRL